MTLYRSATTLMAVALLLVAAGSTRAADNATGIEAPRAAIIASYASDLQAFKRLRGNLSQLTAQINARSDLFGAKPSDDTTLLRPDIRSQILAIWYPIVDTYMALDNLSEKHMQFYQLKQRKDRKRSFHLARCVFLTQYRAALEIITVLEQNPLVDTILNEAHPSLGLPKGVYARFKYQYLNVIKAGRYAGMEAVAKVYKASDDNQLARWAARDRKVILAAGKGPGPVMTFKNGMAIVKRLQHRAWFPVQKGVAEWMGHTKVWRPHQYLIQPKQIETLSGRLEPGDILLERREWYLTNVGIPGFWTHAALFIGNKEQRRLLSHDAQVKQWLRQQGADSLDALIEKRYPAAYAGLYIPYTDGRLPQVIEAISPGVTFTSLHYSATCDSLAVLRPRLSKSQRAAAVVRAMRYYGRPYDYAFDFGSDASLVCTELVVKAYIPDASKKGLDLPMKNLMGRMVTPANAFVEQFDQTAGTQNQQLDLILFLDGREKQMRALISDENEFRKSWARPKWHIWVQSAKTENE